MPSRACRAKPGLLSQVGQSEAKLGQSELCGANQILPSTQRLGFTSKWLYTFFRCVSISSPGIVTHSLTHSVSHSLTQYVPKYVKPYEPLKWCSVRFRMVPNGTWWYPMVPNGAQCYTILPNGNQWYPNFIWWYPVVPNGSQWYKKVHNDTKW